MMATFLPHICFILLIISLICMEAQAGRLGPTPDDEVAALREIGKQVGKKDWNFSVDPCTSNDSSWNTTKSDLRPLYNNSLNCNCTIAVGVCHVDKLFLKGQDLDGVLPPSLVKLHYLKMIDLNRNYLTGTIPPGWASIKLEFLSISVNRLSGPIPHYLGNFTTLICMSLENNLFSGIIPPELGNLVNLENLTLSHNNLTGELPIALTKLTKLQELRISSNNFTGRIPNFFQSWKDLEKLEIQASGLEGPIPRSISVLSNLTELRISDLLGEGSKFPSLSSMTGMKRLMLRSCNLSGQIPPYISKMTELQILFLTSNLLNGPIPSWIIHQNARESDIDLSYNNFSKSSAPPSCRETLNLFRSFSGEDNLTIGGECQTIPCSKDRYSLHINCGGSATTIGDIVYKGDQNQAGPAKFVHEDTASWGFSSSGIFWDISKNISEPYTANNVSILRMNNSGLFTSARLSPLSLTYYASCLANGNYNVTLYFAEIVLRDNRSFLSLGRRIFDVYIQEKLVLKDFDIEHEAQGVDKAIFREFKAVVRNKVLQIRFHWTGKGTTDVPYRGSYGPLISAISVKSDFSPPADYRKIFIVVGAVVSALLLIFMILGIRIWKINRGKITREKELRGLDLQTGFFTYRQIKAATNDFDAANKIGEGGFGSVYKGILLDGSIIAVKKLSSKSNQGNREFLNEIGMISALQHPNLVRLYGCCVEGNQLFLVYEYMENNSLARALFGPEEYHLNLDWPKRQKICVGIARGLAFLHEESTLRIVHRDIKTTNVLLDRDLNPKISDFGLAKLDEEENTHISTRVAGTIGYMAPEYALWGYLTYKADVYAFGVVALEIVTGKSIMKYRPKENCVCLLDWALVLQRKGNLMELVDPQFGSESNKEEAIRMIKVALLCTNPSPALRPTMSAVVSMLEGQTIVDEVTMDPSIYGDELQFSALRDQFEQLQPVTRSTSGAESLMHSSDMTWVGSSATSAQDLYRVNLDTQ